MAVSLTSNNTTVPTQPTKSKGTTYRILTVFPKTIELDELSIPGSDDKSNKKDEDTLSMEFPLIKINDYIFNRDEIQTMKIDCTEFLPKITLTVTFIDQLFLSKEMPKDGDIISIALRHQTDLLNIIRNDYVIIGVHVMPNLTLVKSAVQMTFYGELFIPGLKSQKYDFSFKGTTFEALQDFCKKYGLGFATNEDNTEDKQIWLKANIAGDIHIFNLVDRAWRDTQSFYDCWIDLYYNLNFVNLNKQLISAESQTDPAAALSNIDKAWSFGQNVKQEDTVPTIKVFSNYKNFRTTSFYINSWRPLNKSSNITFKVGTKMSCELFEHNKNLYENPNSQKYWSVTIEPTYDNNKSNKMILLRGRAKYIKSPDNPDLERVNYSYVELYEKYPWLGVQYTISNPDDDNLQWDGNHHKNYQVAKVQNLINLKELEKLNVIIEVNGTNFNIIRGDKMPVVLIKTDSIESMKINQDSKFNDSLDLFYSGWYLVKGFTLMYDNTRTTDESILSNYTQEFVLTRREWPAPMPVESVK